MVIALAVGVIHGFHAVAPLKLRALFNNTARSFVVIHGFHAVAPLKRSLSADDDVSVQSDPRLPRRGPIEARFRSRTGKSTAP